MCDNVGDLKNGKPANCSLIGALGVLDPLQRAVTYISFASSILTFMTTSFSLGPGSFLLVNTISVARTFSIFNPLIDPKIKN